MLSTPHHISFKKNEMDGHTAHTGERKGSYRVLMGRPEGQRPIGRPKCRWEDNIKVHLQEVG
jgi:hypothetical protein